MYTYNFNFKIIIEIIKTSQFIDMHRKLASNIPNVIVLQIFKIRMATFSAYLTNNSA